MTGSRQSELCGPWTIRVCPRCNRVKEASMGCTGAHEDAHPYERTVRVQVVPHADRYREALEAIRDGDYANPQTRRVADAALRSES